jgi:hypothetical protein
MKVTELIQQFAVLETLPVDVNDVLKCLRAHGHDDNIEFIGVDLNPDILQGQIKVFYVRDGLYAADPQRMANIYYHRGHERDWQRMICCKELIHLLDPTTAHSKTPEAIDELAERIGLPPEMQNPGGDGLAANIDRLAEYRALALLFPLAARNLLLEPYRDGKIRLADIARMADIPSRYVGFVMHEVWETAHDILTRE